MRKNKTFVISLVTMGLIILSSIYIVKPVKADDLNWYNTDYQSRNKLYVNCSYVDEYLDYFVVLIDTTMNISQLQDNATDLLFIQDDIELDYEIENYDDETGELLCWVELNYINDTSNTEFYMYYNCIDIVNNEDVEGTWTNEGFQYGGVWHFSEASGLFYDSTSNNNDGTLTDVDSDTLRGQAGVIGNCVDLNGDADYISKSSYLDLDLNVFTYMVWLEPDTEDNWDRIFTKDNLGSYDSGMVIYDNDIVFDKDSSIPSYRGNDVATLNVFKMYTICCPTTESNVEIYYNTTKQSVSSVADSIGTHASPTGFTIGARQSHAANFYDGKIDELRIANIKFSQGRVNASYYSMSIPNLFIIYEETEFYLYPIYPSNFNAVAFKPVYNARIHLSWTKGYLADNTVIYTWSEPDYNYPTMVFPNFDNPELLVDAEIIYNDTGTSYDYYVDTLNAWYCFSAYSWNDVGFSLDYVITHDTVRGPEVTFVYPDFTDCVLDDFSYDIFQDPESSYFVNRVNVTAHSECEDTPITLYENIINVTGTHEYILIDSGYLVWANYTGNNTGGAIWVNWTDNVAVRQTDNGIMLIFGTMLLPMGMILSRTYNRRKKKKDD